MLITKEQQAFIDNYNKDNSFGGPIIALVDNYIKANHSEEEIQGFIDGLEAFIDMVERHHKAR